MATAAATETFKLLMGPSGSIATVFCNILWTAWDIPVSSAPKIKHDAGASNLLSTDPFACSEKPKQ